MWQYIEDSRGEEEEEEEEEEWRRSGVTRQRTNRRGKAEEESDPSGLWIGDKEDEQHCNLRLSLNKHASLLKSHRNLETNNPPQKKPQNKSVYPPLCTQWVHTKAYSRCGCNYFGLGSYPPSKGWAGNIWWLCDIHLPQHRLFITREQLQCAPHSGVTPVLHHAAAAAW